MNAERRMEKKRSRKKKMEAEDSPGNGFIGKRKQVALELSVAIAQPSKKWKSANGSVLRPARTKKQETKKQVPGQARARRASDTNVCA